MPHRITPHHLFMSSAETDEAMRDLAIQLGPFLVAYKDTAATMLAEVRAMLDGEATQVSPEAAELYAAMAGVPPREQRRILECLDIMRMWRTNAMIDVTRAQSVAIYVGPQIWANDEDERETGRRLAALPKA